MNMPPTVSPTTLAFVAYAGGDAVYSFRSENAADTLVDGPEVQPVPRGTPVPRQHGTDIAAADDGDVHQDAFIPGACAACG